MSGRSEADPSRPLSSVWETLRRQAWEAAGAEGAPAGLLAASILDHETFSAALSHQLARKLGDEELSGMSLYEIIQEAHAAAPFIVQQAERDLQAVVERDPACRGFVKPFLFYKGFLALETHRIAHWLYGRGRDALAFHLQSRSSGLFHVDIHPAARFGSGIFLDHGTGIVVGETAALGDDVLIMQGVTLGGTGAKARGRHPTIGNAVLLYAGAKVIGDVRIGDNAKIAAGSLVLDDVPAGCTAVGTPARLVNCAPPSASAPASPPQ